MRIVWSFNFNKCYCQLYDLNRLEPLEKLKECEIEYCDDLIGFTPEAWGKKITPWGRELYRFSRANCDFN